MSAVNTTLESHWHTNNKRTVHCTSYW